MSSQCLCHSNSIWICICSKTLSLAKPALSCCLYLAKHTNTFYRSQEQLRPDHESYLQSCITISFFLPLFLASLFSKSNVLSPLHLLPAPLQLILKFGFSLLQGDYLCILDNHIAGDMIDVLLPVNLSCFYLCAKPLKTGIHRQTDRNTDTHTV